MSSMLFRLDLRTDRNKSGKRLRADPFASPRSFVLKSTMSNVGQLICLEVTKPTQKSIANGVCMEQDTIRSGCSPHVPHGGEG